MWFRVHGICVRSHKAVPQFQDLQIYEVQQRRLAGCIMSQAALSYGCAHAVAASGVFMYRRQRPDLKAGAEAARSRHWGLPGPKQASSGGGLDPPGFLGSPKPGAACFDNPLRAAQGDKGLYSIREDALEVQRNASNYSNTSRDALLPGSGAGPGEGSPPRRPGALGGSPPRLSCSSTAPEWRICTGPEAYMAAQAAWLGE